MLEIMTFLGQCLDPNLRFDARWAGYFKISTAHSWIDINGVSLFPTNSVAQPVVN